MRVAITDADLPSAGVGDSLREAAGIVTADFTRHRGTGG